MARATRVPYLVSGTNEYGGSNLGRGTATVALRLARELLPEGYMDVRVCTPRGRVLQSDELDELKPPKENDMAKGQQRWQSRSQETEEGKSQGDRRGPEPQRGSLATGLRTYKEEVAKRGWRAAVLPPVDGSMTSHPA